MSDLPDLDRLEVHTKLGHCPCAADVLALIAAYRRLEIDLEEAYDVLWSLRHDERAAEE